jgi:DNA-binding transcriptional regulator LsrR (DeoR family)
MKNSKDAVHKRSARSSGNFKKPPSTEEMLKVARWFYKDGLSKEEIIANSGIHAHRLRWLLQQAREKGIVRIDIYEPPGAAIESLENALCKKAGLHKVKIVPCSKIESEMEYAALIRRWGFEAAAYFDTLADTGNVLHVGVSGGETNLEAMTALPDRVRENVHFYGSALIGRGRLPGNTVHVSPSTNATIAWTRSGRLPGHCHFATVPPYDLRIGSKLSITHELDRLAERKPIEDSIREMDAINVAFPGLGPVIPGGNKPAFSKGHFDRLTMTGLLEPVGISPTDLATEGAVGDVSYCLFDDAGEGRKDWRFFLTAGHYAKDPKRRGIGFYKQMVEDGKKVIIIAGTHKVPAILAALKGKLFNVLITDQISAQEIITKL